MKVFGVSIEATFRQILLIGLNVSTVTCLTAFLTWTIRQWSLPNSILLDIPLNFIFHSCPAGGVCSFPMANVTLSNLQHTEAIFSAGIPYQIGVELELADSPMNRELGMVMAMLEMFDRKGHLVSHSMRSLLFPYQSMFVRFLRRTIFFPFFLLGWMHESNSVRVEFHQKYLDDPYTPVQSATVQVEHMSMQIESGRLQIRAVFGFILSFLYNWPLMSNVLLAVLIGGVLTWVSCLFWGQKLLNVLFDHIDAYMDARRKQSRRSMPDVVPARSKSSTKKKPPKAVRVTPISAAAVSLTDDDGGDDFSSIPARSSRSSSLSSAPSPVFQDDSADDEDFSVKESVIDSAAYMPEDDSEATTTTANDGSPVKNPNHKSPPNHNRHLLRRQQQQKNEAKKQQKLKATSSCTAISKSSGSSKDSLEAGSCILRKRTSFTKLE